MLTSKDQTYFNKMIKESKMVLDHLDIPYSRNITWSTFKRNRIWGQCLRKRNSGNPNYQIKITEKLIQSHLDIEVCNTIIHELIHTCKDSFGHTGNWKSYAEIVNKNTNYTIKRVTSTEEKGIPRVYKYKVVCDKCQSVYYYNTKTRFIRNYGVGYRCSCKSKSWHVYDPQDNLVWESHTIEDLLR